MTNSGSHLEQCNVNIKISESTIYTLHQTIIDIQNINVNLNININKLNVDLKTSREEATKCGDTNTDLTCRIKDITDRLGSCQNDRQNDAQEISRIKSKSDEIKKDLDTCKNENINLASCLEVCRKDDTEDEIALQEEIAKLNSTLALLGQCKKSKSELEEDYEKEKCIVADLNIQITLIRKQCADSSENYEKELRDLLEKLNETKSSLQSVTADKQTLESKLKELNIQITHVQNELTIIRKVGTLHISFLSPS